MNIVTIRIYFIEHNAETLWFREKFQEYLPAQRERGGKFLGIRKDYRSMGEANGVKHTDISQVLLNLVARRKSSFRRK